MQYGFLIKRFLFALRKNLKSVLIGMPHAVRRLTIKNGAAETTPPLFWYYPVTVLFIELQPVINAVSA